MNRILAFVRRGLIVICSSIVWTCTSWHAALDLEHERRRANR